MNSKLTLKERIKALTPEEREKLVQYTDALKEIKKEITELLYKKDLEEELGGNHSSNLYLQTEE
jgi:septum formation topological specificity factor MinE